MVQSDWRPGIYAYNIGDSIGGRFHVCDRAPGAFGQVYLCYDQLQDYFYALKTLKLNQKALDNPHTLPNFKREVDTWIALGESDHTVHCFAFEVFDNLPFIILEWVADDDRLTRLYQAQHTDEPWFFDWYARMGQQGLALRQQEALRNQESSGTSLAAWIRSQDRLLPDFALRLTLDICAGMQHAQHIDPELVHRDLKPANVLLTEQLRAKVTDFGTAKILENVIDVGQLGGTAEYMAPEQWRKGDLDGRTDIYAVGCILYEMLTGQKVFLSPTNDRAQLRQKHLNDPPPRLPNQFSYKINEIIQACLEKEPNRRPASFDELSLALANAYETETGELPALLTSSSVDSVEITNKVAITYLNLAKYDTALKQFERAIELDGGYPNTYTNRGCLYHALGQYAEALADYQQAIRLGRMAINSRVFNNRGLVHLALGRLGKAEKDIERAIGLDETYANAHVNLGVVRMAQARYDDALALFQRGLALNPNHAIAQNDCGSIYQHWGQLGTAIDHYTAALDHDPFFLQAWVSRYLAYGALGNDSAAAGDWEQIIKLGGEDISPNELEALAVPNPPDSQLDNRGSLLEILGQPLRQQRLREQYELEAMGLAPKPPDRMPLDSIVTVRAVAYSAQLHDSIMDLQSEGQRVTQLTLQVDVSQADGEHAPFADVQEWDIILDDEATRQMSGRGLHTLADLEGRRLRLRNEYPNDSKHPLRISIAY